MLSAETLTDYLILIYLGVYSQAKLTDDLRRIEREAAMYGNDRKLSAKKPSLTYYDSH